MEHQSLIRGWFSVICVCALSVLLLVDPTLAQTSRATTRPSTRAARGRGQTGPILGELMDYGPFLSYSVLRPGASTAATNAPVPTEGHHAARTDGGELIAVRGITVHVGNNASVCFDTDMLSVAGAWTGGFLDLGRSNLKPGQGPLCAVARGTLSFSTLTDLGWASNGSFADPRPDHQGPLPAAQAHYKGLYRYGNQVVFSYSIGKTDVLEMEGSVAADGQIGFTRTIQLGASDKEQKLLVFDLDGINGRIEANTALLMKDDYETIAGLAAAPSGTSMQIVGGYRVEMTIPPQAKASTIKLVSARIPTDAHATFAALMKQAGNAEDLSALTKGGPAQWNPPSVTEGKRGSDDWAYTVDTVALPDANPWKSLMRVSAFDFLPDGRAVVATMNGDVWIVSGLDDTLSHTMWKRFATGLFEPLGLKVVDGKIYVLGRDQLTILNDLNNDGEADFYENYCNAWATSPIYHAFLMDLQADSQGNFYFSTCGNQAPLSLRERNYGFVMKVPKGGATAEQFANGLRAANGMGVGPHDEVVAADNQGNWTPVCRIDLVNKGGFYGFYNDPRRIKKDQVPELHLPAMYDPPICWLRYPDPDNSSGGQVWAGKDWGPLSGMLLSTSYGKSNLLAIPWEMTDGVPQGGAVKLPLKFQSGIMRARVNPKDGQVWVGGLKGWQTNAGHEGSFERVRYTGKPAHIPVALRVLHDGIAITFSDPLDKTSASDDQNYGVEQWNYHWSETYGSPEFKVSSPNQQGHDVLDLKSVTLSPDAKTVTLHVSELKPVMQMWIQMHIKAADRAAIDWEFGNTINKVPAN